MSRASSRGDIQLTSRLEINGIGRVHHTDRGAVEVVTIGGLISAEHVMSAGKRAPERSSELCKREVVDIRGARGVEICSIEVPCNFVQAKLVSLRPGNLTLKADS